MNFVEMGTFVPGGRGCKPYMANFYKIKQILVPYYGGIGNQYMSCLATVGFTLKINTRCLRGMIVRIPDNERIE